MAKDVDVSFGGLMREGALCIADMRLFDGMSGSTDSCRCAVVLRQVDVE